MSCDIGSAPDPEIFDYSRRRDTQRHTILVTETSSSDTDPENHI